MTAKIPLIVADWRSHAEKLADELELAGKLTTPQWRSAIAAVPRHRLVPCYYRQAGDGRWTQLDTATDEGMATVYSNTVMVTALGEADGAATVLSSSTQPGLMTRMLEALDVHDVHRVLEIGTGTGYNAALLSERLGDDHVFSVDVEADLVDTARARLSELGYCPTLVAGDGYAGLAGHAPFDRIIATCAVPRIPWAWVEQTTLGGVILTDIKPMHGAGSLVRLTRTGTERAEGRFDRTYAAFMDLRREPGTGPVSVQTDYDRTDAHRRVTTLDPGLPWNSMLVWFLASFELGSRISYGYTAPDGETPGWDQSGPTTSWIATPDGSWAEVALATDDAGGHVVAEGGPRRLWQIIEDAHQTWIDLGRPGWDAFGLTVSPDQQTVWFDNPDSDRIWQLAGTRATW